MTPNIDPGRDQCIACGPFFVAETPVYEQVQAANAWVKIKASTLAGAKRAAVKRVRGVTFTAHVATRNTAGEFDTLAQLHNSTAVTRRRALWLTRPGK